MSHTVGIDELFVIKARAARRLRAVGAREAHSLM